MYSVRPAARKLQEEHGPQICYITHLVHCWNGVGCHTQHVDSKRTQMMSLLVWQVFQYPINKHEFVIFGAGGEGHCQCRFAQVGL